MVATKWATAFLWIGLVLTACSQDNVDEDDDDILLDDDFDEIDDVDDFEEYSFGSPQEVHQSWKDAINDLKETAKAAEAAGENSTLPSSCKWGSQSCLHDEDSPLQHTARQEAKGHFVHRRDKQNSNRLNAALLPQIAHATVAIGALPSPPNANAGGGGGGAVVSAGTQCDEGDSECLKKAAMSGALTPGMAAYVASMESVEQVLGGAVVNTGALPNNVSEWEALAEQSRDRHDKKTWGRDHVDVAWRVATERGERMARARMRNRTKVPFPSESDTILKDWFEAKGGVINFAEVQAGRGHRRHLVVTADQSEDLPLEVLKVPFRLTMNKITMRNVGLECNGGCSFLKEHFGPIFKKKEQWGLAVLLLHEQAKGNQSRWYPFIQSLRMYMPSKQVLAELQGTFALELYRLWDEEAEAALQWVNHELCDRHFGKACNFGKTRKEYRWALQVVRSFAFNLTKRTSKSSFLALVPYGNLLEHRHGVGGQALLELDNTIRIRMGSGQLKAGTRVGFERGQLGDAEAMLRYFRVDERDNPHTHIRMLLPGAQGERDELSSFFFRKWKSTMELWRRQMHYPPKMSHMWRMAKELNLYGYEDDDAEEEFMRSQTSDGYKKVLNALPMPEGDASAEEQLELLGYAEDTAAASLILTGKKDSDTQAPVMLYTAQEIDENPNAEHAIQDMADAVLQLHESIAAGHTDPAVQTVIKQARDFLERGVAPPKGLDEIDRLLMRKRFMLKQCGPAETHRINWANISLALKCAIRVTVMNESDVDVLCPKATGPWNDHKCEKSIFNRSLAITWDNEKAMISALRSSLDALLEGMPHSLDEDEALLLLSSFGPAHRSAIRARMREKRLLFTALKHLEQMEADIGDENHVQEYQLLAIKRENEAKARRRERRLQYIKKMQDQGNQTREVIGLDVDLGKDKSERFVVREGEDLERRLDAFTQKHRIAQGGRAQLKQAALGRVSPSRTIQIAVPVILDDGRLRTLALEEGDNVTEAVQLFFATHNVSVDLDESREAELVEHVQDMVKFRIQQQILSRFPVNVPDGRRVTVDVREGEQHDLETHLRAFSAAMNLSPALVPQLVAAASARLPDTVMSMPIDVPNQKKISMKVSSRAAANTSVLWDVATAFCKVNRLPESNVVNLVRGALRGLEPTAFVL